MTEVPPIQPRRFVLVGPVYPYRGGIAHFTEALGRALRARGHRVSAVTFTRQYPERLFPGKTQFETAPAEDPLPTDRLIDTLNPLSWRRAARHVAAQRPDAVVFQYWMPFFAPAYGMMAGYLRRRGVGRLAVVHNALPHEQRPGDAWLTRFFMRRCSGLLALSASVRADLRTLGATAPVRQVEHPVYDLFGAPRPRAEARAALGLPEDAPVVLFFGFIRRYKGLQVLLEAMPRVLEQLPAARLVVAGEFYEDAAPYQAQIRRHGLEAHVHLHAEYIPNPEVTTYFSAADLVVQPYLSATQSGVVQIAYHFERPVLVTDVGGLAEVVPHGRAGLVVPPDDPAALARAVVRFFTEQLAAPLAAGVRQEKQQYSWSRLCEAVEELTVEAE